MLVVARAAAHAAPRRRAGDVGGGRRQTVRHHRGGRRGRPAVADREGVGDVRPGRQMSLAEAALVRARSADELSSLRIVPTPCPSAIVALLGLLRLTKNASSGLEGAVALDGDTDGRGGGAGRDGQRAGLRDVIAGGGGRAVGSRVVESDRRVDGVVTM